MDRRRVVKDDGREESDSVDLDLGGTVDVAVDEDGSVREPDALASNSFSSRASFPRPRLSCVFISIDAKIEVRIKYSLNTNP